MVSVLRQGYKCSCHGCESEAHTGEGKETTVVWWNWMSGEDVVASVYGLEVSDRGSGSREKITALGEEVRV